jgi:hypothetical protein
MASDPSPSTYADSYTPKTLGILNVVFALALMACGLCQNFYAMLPSLMSYANDAMVRDEAKKAEARAQKIQELKAREASAAEGPDRDQIQDERKALEAEAEVKPQRAAMLSAPGLMDPRFLGHFLVDLISNLVLNLLLLISGVGLIFLRSWGRTLAVVVAWTKIVRLFFLAVSMTLVVAPYATTVLSTMEKEMAAAAPKAPPGPSIAAALGMYLTALAWGMFLVGSVYPAVLIWLLGRSSVRMAVESPRPSRTREIDDEA